MPSGHIAILQDGGLIDMACSAASTPAGTSSDQKAVGQPTWARPRSLTSHRYLAVCSPPGTAEPTAAVGAQGMRVVERRSVQPHPVDSIDVPGEPGGQGEQVATEFLPTDSGTSPNW